MNLTLRAKPDWASRFMIEYRVNVHRAARDGALVAEHFHPVNERDNPICFIADETRQRAVFGRCSLLEQLGCSANTESGFLISCASIAASAVTDRAALRWVSCRSILSAMVRS
jgi:hypothetical protein